MTDSDTVFLSALAVSQLVGLDRSVVLKRIRRGDFGKPLSRGRGRTTYVPLVAVEQFTGAKISNSQIELAIGNVPMRRLTISQEAE